MKRRAPQYGFTIVELLIVIVVIGILAAITVVAFNGMQARAENTKTVSAVSGWAKAMQLYKTEVGNYPTVNSCLGSSSTYTNEHSGRCYSTSANSTWVVNATLLTQMSPYLNNYPEPSNKDIHGGVGGEMFRGAMYYQSASGGEEIRVNLFGAQSLSDCPAISGLNTAFGYLAKTSGGFCQYKLPQ